MPQLLPHLTSNGGSRIGSGSVSNHDDIAAGRLPGSGSRKQSGSSEPIFSRGPTMAAAMPSGGSSKQSASGSRKQSTSGDQPIFSRGPTMDGQGHTLPSSHGRPTARNDTSSENDTLSGVAAPAAARLTSDAAAFSTERAAAAAYDGVAAAAQDAWSSASWSGSRKQQADVLMVHPPPADVAADNGVRPQQQQQSGIGQTFVSQLHEAIGSAAPELQPGGPYATGASRISNLPQGILRRSRSWGAAPVGVGIEPPLGSAAAQQQPAVTSGFRVLTLQPGQQQNEQPHQHGQQSLRRMSAPVASPPSPRKQRRRGLFRRALQQSFDAAPMCVAAVGVVLPSDLNGRIELLMFNAQELLSKARELRGSGQGCVLRRGGLARGR